MRAIAFLIGGARTDPAPEPYNLGRPLRIGGLLCVLIIYYVHLSTNGMNMRKIIAFDLVPTSRRSTRGQ